MESSRKMKYLEEAKADFYLLEARILAERSDVEKDETLKALIHNGIYDKSQVQNALTYVVDGEYFALEYTKEEIFSRVKGF